MTAPDHEAAVRAVEEEYDLAWTVGDLDRLIACIHPDAVLVNPRGEVASGAEAIRAALGGFLQGEAKGSAHRSSIDRLSLIGDEVAVVDGRAVIAHPDSAVPLFEHPFTDILTRTGGTWTIAHVRAYVFQSPTGV